MLFKGSQIGCPFFKSMRRRKVRKAAKPVVKKNGLNFNKRRNKTKKTRNTGIISYLFVAVFAIFCGYALARCYGARIKQPNVSMEPTIMSTEISYIDKLAYHIGQPQLNDIIAFKPGNNVNASISIKRIVAMPRDKVLISGGKLYVNGEPVNNTMITTSSIKEAGLAATEIILGDDEYFVLGDNRNSSEDSRFETVGNVKRDRIIGKIWFSVDKDKDKKSDNKE